MLYIKNLTMTHAYDTTQERVQKSKYDKSFHNYNKYEINI